MTSWSTASQRVNLGLVQDLYNLHIIAGGNSYGPVL